MVGPYFVADGELYYKGNKFFRESKLSDLKPPFLEKRHEELSKSSDYFVALVNILDCIYHSTNDFMKNNQAKFFSLPTLTRMISSPGALQGTIPSDVMPFEIDFFGKKTYLTQSSQLYLELALNLSEINALYTIEKSFRNEYTDFRHLPEFSHVEFEGKIDFFSNIEIQKRYFEYLLKYLYEYSKKELLLFLNQIEIEALSKFLVEPSYESITFVEAFRLLHSHTKNDYYKVPSIERFGPKEEVLLSQLLGNKSVFVTEYIANEVAFYHAEFASGDSIFAKNADFIACGYGELIGSGERITTAEEIKQKAERFKLNQDDYSPYIESRSFSNIVHSGWGMGVERFIQFVLRLPAIWNTTCFPRVSNSTRP